MDQVAVAVAVVCWSTVAVVWVGGAIYGVWFSSWLAVVASLREAGWPVRGTRARWRLGELTVDWDAVAPG